MNPVVAGLTCRCPACGEGALFDGYLRVSSRCEACGLDLAAADSGDGPAVFIVLIVGVIVCFSALFTEIAFHPPVWVHLILWLPLAALLYTAMTVDSALRHARGRGGTWKGRDFTPSV